MGSLQRPKKGFDSPNYVWLSKIVNPCFRQYIYVGFQDLGYTFWQKTWKKSDGFRVEQFSFSMLYFDIIFYLVLEKYRFVYVKIQRKGLKIQPNVKIYPYLAIFPRQKFWVLQVYGVKTQCKLIKIRLWVYVMERRCFFLSKIGFVWNMKEFGNIP